MPTLYVSLFSITMLMSILLQHSILADTDAETGASVCSLEDLKARLRDSCSELRVPPHLRNFKRRRRSFSEISIDVSKPRYYVRVKRDHVKAICCTPKLIPIYGHKCIDLYSC